MTQLGLLPHDGRTRAVHTSEEYDVYAGRSRRGSGHMLNTPAGEPGWLGNPYPVRDHGDAALPLFEETFLAMVSSVGPLRSAVLALKGKRLGCPGCPTGSPCHAALIARWIEENAK